MDIRYSFDQMVINYNKIVNDDLSKIFSAIDKLRFEYNRFPEEKVRRHTFLEIIMRGRDENFISYFLAFLLDGKKNGIGNKPLLTLLESIEKGVSHQYRFNNYTVHREWVFQNQRRIDVLIVNEDEQIVIGIENKIGTGEGRNQTKDYEISIYQEFSGYKSILIFLAPYKAKSITSEKFISINYQKLFDIFSKLQIIDFHEIDSFKFFQDFLLHINYNFIINRKKMDKVTFEKALLYAENKKIIDDIRNSYDLIGNQFIDDTADITRNYFNQYQENTWTVNFPKTSEWKQISKIGWVTKELNVHFEWWLKPTDYFGERNIIQFMVDLEGPKSKELISLAKTKDNLKKEVEDNGFSFFPQKRSMGLIYREYPLNKPFYKMIESEKADFFHLAYNDSLFVIPIVDNLLMEFKNFMNAH